MRLPVAEPASVRRVVTLFFAGIAGFTGKSERLDSETVTELMNEIFGMFRAKWR